jgi:hypothetical protein
VQRYGVYCFGADPDETEPLADGPWVRADEAEAELAALRAAVERLRDPMREQTWSERFRVLTERAEAAESRLAAATEIVREALREASHYQARMPQAFVRRASAFLAAQPAAPARTELDACRAEVDRLRGLMCRKPEAAGTPPFRATCRTCGAPLDRETGRHAPEQADRVLAWAGPAARADLDDGCA